MAAVLAIASTAMQVAGAISQGQSQAAFARYNAALADQEAQRARDEARYQEKRVREQAGKTLSALGAGYGAAGVAMEGTALDVLGESAENAELDALQVRYAGSAAEARAKAQATQDRMAAKIYQQQGYLRAASSLLGGASSIYDKYGSKLGLP